MVPTDTLFEDGGSWIETDPILPVSLEHFCQEQFSSRGLREKYNFLVYRFERDGAEVTCRAYLDNSDEVAIFAPRRLGEGLTEEVHAPALREDVLRFLSRRFHLIQELTATGYEPVWIAGHYRSLLVYREQQARLQPELLPAPLP